MANAMARLPHRVNPHYGCLVLNVKWTSRVALQSICNLGCTSKKYRITINAGGIWARTLSLKRRNGARLDTVPQ
jgi:hypothetical protein